MENPRLRLQEEKEELEAAIENKMERYIELQEMVDSFSKGKSD